MVPRSLIGEVHKSRPEVLRGGDIDSKAFTGERFLPGYADGSIELYHLHRYSFALPFVVGKRVLDIACGEGYGCDLMAQVATWVSGIDVDAQVIQNARRRYPRHNLSFVEGDTGAIPAADESVDVVVSFETLEHIPDQETFWAEIRRVLTRQGVLIISSPNRDGYNKNRSVKNAFHVKELTQQEFTGELAAHFREYRLYTQSVVFGSSAEPMMDEGAPASTISVDPETSVLCWTVNESLPAPYLIAIAGEKLPFLPERTLYTGRYPPDAMASLAGGIIERDRLIEELRSQMAGRQRDQPVTASSNSKTTSATQLLTESAGQNDLVIQERDQAVVEGKRLKETLMEQEGVIQAMKALLEDCRQKRATGDESKAALQNLPDIRPWSG